MKKIFIFCLIFLLLVASSYSEELTCQYTSIEEYSVLGDIYYLDKEPIEGYPQILNYTVTSTEVIFLTYNPFNFSIDVKLVWRAGGGVKGDTMQYLEGTISPGGYKEFVGEYLQASNIEVPHLEVLDPELVIKKEEIVKQREICKQCNGKNCLDDGESCGKDAECGGTHCVESVCTTSDKCYKNDCKCEANEVQCETNYKCVKRLSIEEGSKPICSFEECVTKYIDPDIGLCVKSPKQVQLEEKQQREAKIKEEKDRTDKMTMFLVISFILIVITVFIGLIYYTKVKGIFEEIKRKRIEKEILKFQEEKFITENLKKFKENEEEWIKPYRSRTRAFWEWRNPNISNKYYPCYVNKANNGDYTLKTDIEIHKDLAKKEIFNIYRKWYEKHYPGKSFEQLVVHHIDKDIFNYNLANLVIMDNIDKKEHDNFPHGKVPHKNWDIGVEELKKMGIKAPHIEELGGESLTDPYEILGIDKGASQEEIKKAYKNLIQINHPDKVSHLDKKFQILAEQRSKKIIEAYDKLKQ